MLGFPLCAGAAADEQTGALPSGPSAAGARADAGGWITLGSSRIARTEVAAAPVGRSIYVVGGFTSGGAPTREVERYDTTRDRWELVAPMPVAVNHAAAVGYRGDLYVLGGYSGAPFSFGIGTDGVADATSAFFRYDPETDSWSQMPAAPTRRAAMAAAVIGDELYVAGGADSLRPLTTLEVFDFETRTWRRAPNMPLPTEHTAGAAVDGELYVVSGRPSYIEETNRFVQRYRPGTQRWDRVADLSSGRGGLAAVAACDRLVAFGGEDPRRGPPGTVPEVERYDPARDAWDRLPDMRTPRHGLGGAAIGRRIYALEGGDVTSLSVTNTAEALDLSCAQTPAGGAPDRQDGFQRPGTQTSGGGRGVTLRRQRQGSLAGTGSPPSPQGEAADGDGFLPVTGARLVLLVACAVGLLVGGIAIRAVAANGGARRRARAAGR